MAYGASICLQDLSLISSHQHFSSDSTTLLSGGCKVWTKKTTKQTFHRRCIGLSQSNRPVTQWPEKAIKANGNIKEPLQVSDLNEKIKRGIHVVKERVQSVDDGNLSLSAYDTAWVALVKDIDGSDAPMFPSSLDWIINNQLPDGSWGDPYYFCAYDRLSCTLACVVALKTWNINPEGCEKGLSFLRQNVHKLHEEDPEHQLSGFEVTFPTLVEMAQKLGLRVVQNSSVLQDLLAKRDLKLKRIPKEILYFVPTTLLHSLEGMPDLDWEKLLKLQHPNGSFLCSPSSTAYALMKTKDENCSRYLTEIVQRFNGGVPHSYPMDLFERLWVVDRFERLGFSRYFKSEIKELLDYVYRCWTQNGISWSRDTIEFDIDDTCMGLRMLRLHGYDVNGSALQHFEREGKFFCFIGQNSQGITEMLSLYRASQLLFPGEKILEEAKAFSFNFLRKKQDLGQINADRWLITKDLVGEVNYYLDVPWYANLPRIETRHYIDHYGGDDDVWIAKTLYRMYNVSTNDYLELAKVDYNHCQQLHRLEWNGIQMWYEDYNLKEFGLYKDDLLKFYFVAMSSMFEPEQATERLAWAKTAALIEIVRIYYKERSLGQIKDFIQAFDNREFGSNGSQNELVDVIHKILNEIASNVRGIHGKDVCYNLKHLWNTWLLKMRTQGDACHVPEDEAELLVKTINLCAGNSIDLIPQPEYVHLTNLTNEICNRLREIQNIKVGRKANDTKEMVNNLPIESLDRQMQELVQHVVKTEDGIDQQIRHTFLTVAKGYYYTSYCEPATIDIHIAKVLFEQVIWST